RRVHPGEAPMTAGLAASVPARLYGALILARWSRTGVCWVEQEKLAAEFDVTTRAIRRWEEMNKDAGLWTIAPRGRRRKLVPSNTGHGCPPSGRVTPDPVGRTEDNRCPNAGHPRPRTSRTRQDSTAPVAEPGLGNQESVLVAEVLHDVRGCGVAAPDLSER